MKRTRQGNGRASIYKGADDHWHGRVTVGITDDGRSDRRHVMSRSRATVVERVRDLERARDRGELQAVSERWTVEGWLNHWLENVSRPFVRQSTYEGYRAAITVHLIPGLGRHQLASLKPEHLERLYVKMLQLTTRRGTPMRPARVHQVHRTIRAALNEAVRRGYITRNPAAFAKTPAVEEYEVEPYDVADVQAIFRAAEDRRNGTRWIVALALGLRQGEALGIRWPDIDWDRQLLAVRRGTPRPRFAHGCAQPCGRKYAGHCPQRRSLNADRRPDQVPGRPALRAAARRPSSSGCASTGTAQELERQTAAQLWVDEGWVFADELGRRINPRTDWAHWKQLLRDAGVRDGRLHDARHTAATVLLLLGVHERTIMSILGWSSTAMVSRYAHVIAPIHRDVAGRLDGLLWSSPQDQIAGRAVGD